MNQSHTPSIENGKYGFRMIDKLFLESSCTKRLDEIFTGHYDFFKLLGYKSFIRIVLKQENAAHAFRFITLCENFRSMGLIRPRIAVMFESNDEDLKRISLLQDIIDIMFFHISVKTDLVQKIFMPKPIYYFYYRFENQEEIVSNPELLARFSDLTHFIIAMQMAQVEPPLVKLLNIVKPFTSIKKQIIYIQKKVICYWDENAYREDRRLLEDNKRGIICSLGENVRLIIGNRTILTHGEDWLACIERTLRC